MILKVTVLLNQRWLRAVQTMTPIKSTTMAMTKIPVISLTRRNLNRSDMIAFG
jgi:hypothetical protein